MLKYLEKRMEGGIKNTSFKTDGPMHLAHASVHLFLLISIIAFSRFIAAYEFETKI
ncbi:hypothetical protein RWE15_06580 [Virgibacillus halophilus]|uniref:Uncharacterized protein n=1 Tax=Tigheibacillus halophilus TaxID=361280 RepID=A0ABU5C558_9BACI|nr:hypothetical protein [Virgibacillus halophilus]